MADHWNVYQRKSNGDLELVADIAGKTPEEAVHNWTQRFGDNYGKVILMPLHHAYGHMAFTPAQ